MKNAFAILFTAEVLLGCGAKSGSTCHKNSDCQSGLSCETVCGSSSQCFKPCSSNADCTGISTASSCNYVCTSTACYANGAMLCVPNSSCGV